MSLFFLDSLLQKVWRYIVPYGIFLDLATLGIPTGITRLIAEQQEEHKLGYSQYLYQRIRRVSLLLGFVMFLILFLLSTPLAYIIIGGKEDVTNSIQDVRLVIQMISLALLIIPNLSLLRGIFNGLKQTEQTARSQVIEQVIRVGMILISAYLIIKIFNGSYRPVIYLSVLAASISGALTFVILRLKYRRLKKPDLDMTFSISTKRFLKQVFAYALPAVFITLLLGLFNLTDTLTFNWAFSLGHHPASEAQYATYIFEVQKLVYLPIAFGVSLGTSFMVYANNENTHPKLHQQMTRAIEILCFILMPIILLFMVFSHEIYRILFGNTLYGPDILQSAAPLILPFALLHVLSGMMQRLHKEWIFIRHLLLGVFIKLLFNVPLIIRFETNGAILSSFIGYMVPVVLNLFVLIRDLELNMTYTLRRLVIITILSIGLATPFSLIQGYFLKPTFPFIVRLIVLGGMSLVYLILYLLGCYGLGLIDCLFNTRITLRQLIKGEWLIKR